MTSLLDANDARGQYPGSYYAATATIPDPRPAWSGGAPVDVCIIGAGFTGLSAGYHLAKAGRSVAVIDAHRAGWGASGRNGGQLGSGQRVEQPDLEAEYGQSDARAMWQIGQDAKALVRSLIHEHHIDCDLKSGVAHVNHRKRFDEDTRAYADHMNDKYDYPLEYLDADACRALVNSPRYTSGTLDRDAGHLHPLNFALGLAGAAEAAGARIFEQTRAKRIDSQMGEVETDHGTIKADQILLAGNGYIEGIHPGKSVRVMPVNNYIIATEPMPAEIARSLISEDIAVADSKFVVNYFRFSADNRLLFGGRESYGYRFPADIKPFVRKAMIDIFPQTSEMGIDYGWGGTLAITMTRLPYLRALGRRLWNASGYSGHGVAMATMSGKIIADAIVGQTGDFDVMSRIKAPAFPGGTRFRNPLLVAAMLWYSLRDRL
jgi:gamma-glutamylputrescine oxidase